MSAVQNKLAKDETSLAQANKAITDVQKDYNDANSKLKDLATAQKSLSQAQQSLTQANQTLNNDEKSLKQKQSALNNAKHELTVAQQAYQKAQAAAHKVQNNHSSSVSSGSAMSNDNVAHADTVNGTVSTNKNKVAGVTENSNSGHQVINERHTVPLTTADLGSTIYLRHNNNSQTIDNATVSHVNVVTSTNDNEMVSGKLSTTSQVILPLADGNQKGTKISADNEDSISQNNVVLSHKLSCSNVLPKTGNTNNEESTLGIIAAGFAGIMSLLVLGYKRKH